MDESILKSEVSASLEMELQVWIQEARAGRMSWMEIGERLLGAQHALHALDRPDTDRSRRCGFGEVIFGQSKSAETIVEIASRLLQAGQSEVLVTRVTSSLLKGIVSGFPFSRYDTVGRTLRLSSRPIAAIDALEESPKNPEVSARLGNHPKVPQRGLVLVAVVTAGSTDLPVAREALETLRWMGVAAELITDVGVAGPYRLLPHLPLLRTCMAVVVCAGMEGALASVMGGLIGCPVIAVPTSIGYGSNLAGITTLLSMISSCAAGVTVVNVDAGFKGGYVAGLIASRCSAAKN